MVQKNEKKIKGSSDKNLVKNKGHHDSTSNSENESER